jgi:hypothetical protein
MSLESVVVNCHFQNRRRVLSALACLLAVVFLYAPFAAAAWSSRDMACCTAGYCNIPKHHHSKAPAHSTAGEECDHGAAGMMNCAMACCQDVDKLVVTSLAFVLPPATTAFSASLVSRSALRVRSIEIPRTIQPLSPPPRTDNTVL